jgi:hypothetical protein
MAYDTTIPAATHTPAQDQPLMQGNFLQIANSYNTDHIPLTSGSNIGFSNKTTYVNQASDPAAVASTGIVYSKTVGGHTELFYEGEAASGKILQITNQNLTTSSGEGFIPGGLQIRSGSASANGAGFFNTFSTAFPVMCLSVVAVPTNLGQKTNFIKVSGIGTTGFTLTAFNASTGGVGLGEACFFIATGY